MKHPETKTNKKTLIIKYFVLWFKVVILGKLEIKGYNYKKIGNYPIVGVHHFEGYELINSKSGKVLYRKVKDWGIIGSNIMSYNPKVYDTVSKFFPKNII